MDTHSHGPGPSPAVWKVVLADIGLTLLILAVFFFFQLALPILRARSVPAAEPAPEPTSEPTAMEVVPEATPEPTPDTRTPWQIRFAEHFSDEPVLTDHSYQSAQVSIDIQTFRKDVSNGRKAVYHVADIYLASPEQFSTYTANNELKYFSVQNVDEMDLAAHAILSVSGDCYSYQPYGFLLRNGQLYLTNQTYGDICVLYRDGRLATYTGGEYTVDGILAEDPAQVWSFGPSLLDAEGHVKPGYNTSAAVGYPNPRCAIGYYEPGHYCFVVVDGRQTDYSDGMLIAELAQVFEELGCVCAYNLDGGGTAVMYFNHQPFSRQSNGADRQIGDILVITEEGFQ